MDIAKLLVKMGMYSFDVGSDVANGIHFLHGDNHSDGKKLYNAISEDQFFQGCLQSFTESPSVGGGFALQMFTRLKRKME